MMKLRYLAILLTVYNFVWAQFVTHNFTLAAERSYFQALAILAVYFISLPLRSKNENPNDGQRPKFDNVVR